jgi:Zn-dependent protease
VWGFAFKETVVFCIVGEMLPYRALTYLVTLPVFLVSLTIHEYAHAWVAYRFGDDTAKRMGRLTLNPLAHIRAFLMATTIKFGGGLCTGLCAAGLHQGIQAALFPGFGQDAEPRTTWKR